MKTPNAGPAWRSCCPSLATPPAGIHSWSLLVLPGIYWSGYEVPFGVVVEVAPPSDD